MWLLIVWLDLPNMIRISHLKNQKDQDFSNLFPRIFLKYFKNILRIMQSKRACVAPNSVVRLSKHAQCIPFETQKGLRFPKLTYCFTKLHTCFRFSLSSFYVKIKLISSQFNICIQSFHRFHYESRNNKIYQMWDVLSLIRNS